MFFTSFLLRDQAYTCLEKTWKEYHQNNKENKIEKNQKDEFSNKKFFIYNNWKIDNKEITENIFKNNLGNLFF